MVKVFADTSALFALVNSSEQNHQTAKTIWNRFITNGSELITNNYVIVESLALIQNRLGLSVTRHFQENIMPLLDIVWFDQELHEATIQRLLVANRRQLSLVDCSSFETMHRLKLETVFTFDEHFREQGFTVIP